MACPRCSRRAIQWPLKAASCPNAAGSSRRAPRLGPAKKPRRWTTRTRQEPSPGELPTRRRGQPAEQLAATVPPSSAIRCNATPSIARTGRTRPAAVALAPIATRFDGGSLLARPGRSGNSQAGDGARRLDDRMLRPRRRGVVGVSFVTGPVAQVAQIRGAVTNEEPMFACGATIDVADRRRLAAPPASHWHRIGFAPAAMLPATLTPFGGDAMATVSLGCAAKSRVAWSSVWIAHDASPFGMLP